MGEISSDMTSVNFFKCFRLKEGALVFCGGRRAGSEGVGVLSQFSVNSNPLTVSSGDQQQIVFICSETYDV